jgi:hypothetical protein
MGGQRRTKGGLENGLVNLWMRKRIMKKAHAGRGQESKWGILIYRSTLLFD